MLIETNERIHGSFIPDYVKWDPGKQNCISYETEFLISFN